MKNNGTGGAKGGLLFLKGGHMCTQMKLFKANLDYHRDYMYVCKRCTCLQLEVKFHVSQLLSLCYDVVIHLKISVARKLSALCMHTSIIYLSS